ncbi:MAG TPA: hypothetical protein VNO33_11615, partial [Kofleriaceae bacterium]|nr:hypothetical protein [Kofleriaceae bacterium]
MSGAQPPPARRRVLRIASACATREAFVSAFGRYCDGEVIFVATRSPRPSGEELSFRFTLAGGEPLIVGTGRVEQSYHSDEGPNGRAGMLIRFLEVEPASRVLIEELAAVPAPEGFPRGTEPPRHRHELETSEPDSETRPSGLPRSLVGPRATITPAPTLVPKPSGPLTVKPAATPPPLIVETAPDDAPTGVKSMQAIARSRRRRAGEPDIDEESGWDEAASEVFGETGLRGSRVVLRADPHGRLEPSSVEGLVECALYEESGAAAMVDERGLPKLSTGHGGLSDDAWDDDQTLPPWLRGPSAVPADDDMDVPTGMIRVEDALTEP